MNKEYYKCGVNYYRPSHRDKPFPYSFGPR